MKTTEKVTPRYLEIAQALASEIAEGRFISQLPTEKDLAQRFGVSRLTVRRALSALAETGLVAPSWGRGWYVVTEPLSEPPNALLSFTELAERRGLTPSGKLLNLTTRPATLDEAEVLRIAAGSSLVEIDRLRLMNEVPTVLQHSLLPLSKLAGLDLDSLRLELAGGSLYRLLEERHGVIAMRADYLVEARAASPEEAELLQISLGSPVLQTTQVTFDSFGGPFEKHRSVYPHDRYRFQATLTRPLSFESLTRAANVRRLSGPALSEATR
jgi:GntR family transcriptional regulator